MNLIKQPVCNEAYRLLAFYNWFTQFDFPDENRKPYRASGGQMEWNDTLKRNIPTGWRVAPFLEVASWESNSQPPKIEFIYELHKSE